VKIERFDGLTEPERVHDCYEIVQACLPVDEPDMPGWSRGAFTTKWAHGFSPDPRETWLGFDAAGEPVGCYMLTLPENENTSIGGVVLRVRPDRRRAGNGSALLRHCAERARLAGRTRLRGEAWDDSAGVAFATVAGASGGIAEVFRVLRLDDKTRRTASRLHGEAAAHSRDYSLLSWAGLTPEEHLDQIARVHAAMADAPRDADVEESIWDGDRIRRIAQLMTAYGAVPYGVGARHEPTGEFAAVTQVLADPGIPGWGFQQLTAVRADHRGHRLGLLVKTRMLEVLGDAEPGISRIMTANAGANEHMIAINARLGFEVSRVSRSWELDLTSSG
jgi:GNAT superfamily N-acetyltransferase